MALCGFQQTIGSLVVWNGKIYGMEKEKGTIYLRLLKTCIFWKMDSDIAIDIVTS